MMNEEGAMMLVRAELCEMLEALRSFRTVSARELASTIGPMRALAATYGLTPVVRLAEALEGAMTQGTRSAYQCPIALYIDRLQDAIGCTRLDEQASEALLASVSVRLA